jgi:transcriptional regulator with XRE-family HTH domain
VTAPVQVGPSSSSGGPAPFDLEDYLADIGDRIRAERQARGWSQTELGRRAGIGLATVKRLEAGGVSMRPLVHACWALEVPLDRLLSDRWRLTERGLSLSPRQVDVLLEAASMEPLSVVGARLGMDAQAVSSHLSRIYQRLGVADLPREERRAAAVRVASEHGLFNSA